MSPTQSARRVTVAGLFAAPFDALLDVVSEPQPTSPKTMTANAQLAIDLTDAECHMSM